MVWSELGGHLVFKNTVLQFLPGASIVNSMWGSMEFKLLKKVSTCSFFTMLIMSSTHLSARGRYGALRA